MTGDMPEARRCLNELLGHIFFSSANDLDVIKVRAIELVILISRAALDSGADVSNVLYLNTKFISAFLRKNTIEEVCMSLTGILKRFSDETAALGGVKHVDVITRALKYIKANINRRITLEEVATQVFLSPSYFSKLFRDEMKCYFTDYLNQLKIERGKLLLLDDTLTITEIVEALGFYDQSYFNKIFKRLTGTTPKHYRDTRGLSGAG